MQSSQSIESYARFNRSLQEFSRTMAMIVEQMVVPMKTLALTYSKANMTMYFSVSPTCKLILSNVTSQYNIKLDIS